MSEPFLPYDYARCSNPECEDRSSCLRHLTREQQGPRTATVLWEKNPENKSECGMYLRYEHEPSPSP
jgi:hypothetical protein